MILSSKFICLVAGKHWCLFGMGIQRREEMLDCPPPLMHHRTAGCLCRIHPTEFHPKNLEILLNGGTRIQV